MPDAKKPDDNKTVPPFTAEPLPTTGFPRVVSSVHTAGVPLPPKTGVAAAAQPEAEAGPAPAPASTASAPAPATEPELPAEPIERRVHILHSIVVDQVRQIAVLRTELALLNKKIDDFNTRSPHKL